MIAMIVIGCVLIPFYVLWDVKVANHPVIPRRFWLNRSVVIACVVGAFDFVSDFLLDSMTDAHGGILVVLLHILHLPLFLRHRRQTLVSLMIFHIWYFTNANFQVAPRPDIFFSDSNRRLDRIWHCCWNCHAFPPPL